MRQLDLGGLPKPKLRAARHRVPVNRPGVVRSRASHQKRGPDCSSGPPPRWTRSSPAASSDQQHRCSDKQITGVGRAGRHGASHLGHAGWRGAARAAAAAIFERRITGASRRLEADQQTEREGERRQKSHAHNCCNQHARAFARKQMNTQVGEVCPLGPACPGPRSNSPARRGGSSTARRRSDWPGPAPAKPTVRSLNGRGTLASAG